MSTAQEIRESMRLKLRRAGLAFNEKGEAMARRSRKYLLRDLHEEIERLEPPDLLSVLVIVGDLTRTDAPPAQEPTKRRVKKAR